MMMMMITGRISWLYCFILSVSVFTFYIVCLCDE